MSSSTPLVPTRHKSKNAEPHKHSDGNDVEISLVDVPDNSKNKFKRIGLLMVVVIVIVAVILIIYFVVTADSKKTQNNVWPMFASTLYGQHPSVVDTGYRELIATNSTLSAIVAAASLCEEICSAVGWGDNPDATNEVTLDAMIIYGPTRKAGCVGQLRNIKNAMGVARAILIYTKHTMLVGESAMEFALEMGFESESLSSNQSNAQYQNWLNNNCQPHFWQNVLNATNQCGPYTKMEISDKEFEQQENELLRLKNVETYTGLVDEYNHDTVSFIAIDADGIMSVGTTTNGLDFKIHGRVGDSPIPGGGSYVKQGVGGCGAVGNGDIMLRFLPTYKGVMHMENGKTPYEAIQLTMEEIRSVHSPFFGNMICVAADGSHASGSSNANEAKAYLVRSAEMSETQLWTCQSNGECNAVE